MDRQHPQTELSLAAHTGSASAEEPETGRSLELTGWPAEAVDSRVPDRPYLGK